MLMQQLTFSGMWVGVVLFGLQHWVALLKVTLSSVFSFTQRNLFIAKEQHMITAPSATVGHLH